ncbi:EscR/YscR/HrcR family type III secretion system export apparatus protein [Shewanella waksmanii]|uniref:EscR/YscR/HrcR family type III secretion system export apparatus protein n=1 Tax=Shewanella waksmanii TaxID=213783 RepID=UPI003735F837
MQPILSVENPLAGANLVLLLTLVLLSSVFFICFSGYIKYNIILNIIKNAIGTQQIPPNIVVNLLAALMALNSVWPDISPGLARIEPLFKKMGEGEYREELFNLADNAADGKQNETVTMYRLVTSMFDYFPEMLERAENKTEKLTELIDIPDYIENSNSTLKHFLCAMVLDLYQGFEYGLKLYLIFVSIDFLIAVILSGVGMTMLSPTVISIPVKLAVFYFSESWTILFKLAE